jgi:hypothetical protein
MWEQSLLAIGCEAVAEEVTAPLHESSCRLYRGQGGSPPRSHQPMCLWEQSLLAIGCEAEMMNAPLQEIRANFIADFTKTLPRLCQDFAKTK